MADSNTEVPRRYPSGEDCAAILVAADRTCCVCRVGGKAVQLHHIDENRSNDDPVNFAVLCLECHNETQRRGGFGRQLNAAQVRLYRDEWNDAVTKRLMGGATDGSKGEVVLGAPLIRSDDVIDRVLMEANRSPKIGMRLIDAKLQQDARRILAGSGWGGGQHDWTLRQSIDRLFELGVVSASVHKSLDVFESMRASIDAGIPVERIEVMRALDVGILTYRSLAVIPRERHYVTDAQIAVFQDQNGMTPLPNLYAIRIQSTGPPPREPHDGVFLTRGNQYRLGSEVTWLWGKEVLGPAWFFDLRSGQYETAHSVEFGGLLLEAVA